MRIVFILTLLILLFCSSCAKIFFPTNHHQIVSPNKKGSLQITGGYFDTYVSGLSRPYPAPLERFAYGVQIGYSPVEHLGVIANYFRPNYIATPNTGGNFTSGAFTPGGRSSSFTTNAYFGYLADGAVGFYQNKQTKGTYLKNKNNFFFDDTNEWLFDVYAGGGKGHLSTNYSIVGFKEVDFNLYYIQGGVHWKNGKVGVELVERIIGTDFKKFDFVGNIFEDDLERAQSISAKPFRLASRTSVRLSVGQNYGKIYLEGNKAHFSDGNERFYFNNERFSIGVLLELDECYRSLKNWKRKKRRKK